MKQLAYTQTGKHEHLFGFWYAPLSEHMFFLGISTFYLRVEQMFGFVRSENPASKIEHLFCFCGVKIYRKNFKIYT